MTPRITQAAYKSAVGKTLIWFPTREHYASLELDPTSAPCPAVLEVTALIAAQAAGKYRSQNTVVFDRNDAATFAAVCTFWQAAAAELDDRALIELFVADWQSRLIQASSHPNFAEVFQTDTIKWFVRDGLFDIIDHCDMDLRHRIINHETGGTMIGTYLAFATQEDKATLVDFLRAELVRYGEYVLYENPARNATGAQYLAALTQLAVS